MATIHPLSVVDPNATLGNDVDIGPFCVVGPHVILQDKVRLISHVSLQGHTTLHEGVTVYPHACIGHAPQDLKYDNEPSTLSVGAHTVIREYVTIHPGTRGGLMKTVVGDHCLLMGGVHIAHDCVVGNHVVMANYATLAGHVKVDDYVTIGGLSAVQQFVRIGAYAMIGGMSGVEKDVIPYGVVLGERAHLQGLNIIGLRRHGFTTNDIAEIQQSYQAIFKDEQTAPFKERVKKQRESHGYETPPVLKPLYHFIENEDTKRHFCMPM